MPQPTPYVITKDFSDDEANNVAGRSEVSTAGLDTEHANIETTIGEILNNLAIIQRDDTLLGNDVVHPDSLNAATLALIGSTWTPKGLWVTTTAYVVGDVVEESGSSYVCATAHTSGVFSTDQGNGYWIILAGQPLDATLTALAALATAADQMIYSTGSDTFALATLTSFARTLLNDTNAAGVLTTLGVTAFIQTLFAAASASAARTTLAVYSNTEVYSKAETNALVYSVTATGRDTYTAILGITAYTTTRTYNISIAKTNLTSTPTIEFDSLGAKTIKSMAGLALKIGELPPKALLEYDGTDMLLLNPVIDYPGKIASWPTSAPPVGSVERDGSLYDMTAYQPLYAVIGNDSGLNAGVVFTAAVDDALTSAAHGKIDNDVFEVSTDTTLPAGLSANTKYFVINATTNTFKVSLTEGGSAVDITDTGTGVHKFHDEFAVPDNRGEFERIWNNGAGIDPDAASRTDRGDGTTGDNVLTKQAGELETHAHTTNLYMGSGGSSVSGLPYGAYAIDNTDYPSSAVGGNETRPINYNAMGIIYF